MNGQSELIEEKHVSMGKDLVHGHSEKGKLHGKCKQED